MCNLGEGIAERGIEKGIEIGIEQGVEQATVEHVTSMFMNHFAPEQIALGLNLSLDRVMAILTQQGLLQP